MLWCLLVLIPEWLFESLTICFYSQFSFLFFLFSVFCLTISYLANLFCGKREKKEEREREKGEIVEERDVYYTLPFLRMFLHFKIKYVRVIRKYELSS